VLKISGCQVLSFWVILCYSLSVSLILANCLIFILHFSRYGNRRRQILAEKNRILMIDGPSWAKKIVDVIAATTPIGALLRV